MALAGHGDSLEARRPLVLRTARRRELAYLERRDELTAEALLAEGVTAE